MARARPSARTSRPIAVAQRIADDRALDAAPGGRHRCVRWAALITTTCRSRSGKRSAKASATIRRTTRRCRRRPRRCRTGRARAAGSMPGRSAHAGNSSRRASVRCCRGCHRDNRCRARETGRCRARDPGPAIPVHHRRVVAIADDAPGGNATHRGDHRAGRALQAPGDRERRDASAVLECEAHPRGRSRHRESRLRDASEGTVLEDSISDAAEHMNSRSPNGLGWPDGFALDTRLDGCRGKGPARGGVHDNSSVGGLTSPWSWHLCGSRRFRRLPRRRWASPSAGLDERARV